MTENNKATGLLFTSATCPHCPIAKKYFDELKEERDDVDLHSISINDPRGNKFAQGFGVQSVPTFIFYGPGHEEPMGLAGGQTKETLGKYIDIAVGKKTMDKTPSFSVKNLLRKRQ